MRQPRSYIVRIYRQGARNLTGVVQDAQTGEQRPFSNIQELWTLLRRPLPTSTPSRDGESPA
jgi:hypothetical protein